MGEYKFERIQEFIFLGSCITQKSEIQTKIRARIQAGNRYYLWTKLGTKVNNINKKYKDPIGKLTLPNCNMACCDVWKRNMQKIQENNLLTFKRRILRKIFGSCLDTNTRIPEWRIRNNEEIKELYR